MFTRYGKDMSMCFLFRTCFCGQNKNVKREIETLMYLNVLLHLNGLKTCESDMRCRLWGELLIG